MKYYLLALFMCWLLAVAGCGGGMHIPQEQTAKPTVVPIKITSAPAKMATDMTRDEALEYARQLINKSQFAEAEAFISPKPEYLGRSYGPSMLKTARNFMKAERLISEEKYSEAKNIVDDIAVMVCCALKDKIYPDAIEQMTAQINKGLELEGKRKEEQTTAVTPYALPPVRIPDINIKITHNPLVQKVMTLLDEGKYQEAFDFAAQNAALIHPQYGSQFAQGVGVFLQARQLAACGKTQEAELIINNLQAVNCCYNGRVYQQPINTFLQKLQAGAFKEPVTDKKANPPKGKNDQPIENSK